MVKYSENVVKLRAEITALRTQKKGINLTKARKIVGKVNGFDPKFSYAVDRKTGEIVQTDLTNPDKIKQMNIKHEIKDKKKQLASLMMTERLEGSKKVAERSGEVLARKLTRQNAKMQRIAERKAKLQAKAAKLEAEARALK